MLSKPQKPKRWWRILRWLGVGALIIFVGIFVGIPTVMTTPVPSLNPVTLQEIASELPSLISCSYDI